MIWIAALCFVSGILLGAGLALIVAWVVGKAAEMGDE